MKQIVFSSGKPFCMEFPKPSSAEEKHLLVALKASCISPGTELAGLQSSGKSLIQKAKEDPQKAIEAISRIKSKGLSAFLGATKLKAAQEGLAGYSAAGIVEECGSNTTGFSRGMRVAVAGAGYANHAEYVSVPVNLALPIPENVSDSAASTCALGGIALQGVRRAEVSIGDMVVVYGCGVIGLLTIQILKAAGCRIIAIDLDSNRLALASQYGAEIVINPEKANLQEKVFHQTGGYGADRIILTLATSSNDPVNHAFSMARRKGRVVLVGVAGLQFERSEMYRKELDFVISTSYGPGRYDPTYEEKGIDYPYDYVRWTENRNMQAYLHLISQGDVSVDDLIYKSYPPEQASQAYSALRSSKKPLLALFTYEPSDALSNAPIISESKRWKTPSTSYLKVGIVGAGSFVQGMHIPNLNKLADSFQVKSIFDKAGVSSRHARKALGGSGISLHADYHEFLATDIDLVLIGTRHNTHAHFSIEALKSGKAVFVEKPMCITIEEYKTLTDTINDTGAPYMVGYNRRFAPAVQMIKSATDNRVNPLMIQYTMNAGYVPYDAWVHTDEGGGRIVGEGCHIFDLFRYLVDAPADKVTVSGIQPKTSSIRASDNAVISITYEDGSVCSLIYTSIGNKQAPKERMEVFFDQQLLVLDDYQKLSSYGNRITWSSKQPDKGHLNELVFLRDSILAGNRFPITYDELKETWTISRQIADILDQ